MREGKFRNTANSITADGAFPHPLPDQVRPRPCGALLPVAAGAKAVHGCTTVIVDGVDLPTPRISGRYMSSTSGGGTVYTPGVTARTR